MAAESSTFESKEMPTTFLASTAFVEESGSLGSSANSADLRSFPADQCGEVRYLAFSGQQVIDWSEPSCETQKVQGECRFEHPFSPLKSDGYVEGTVFPLNLKCDQRQDFQNQNPKEILEDIQGPPMLNKACDGKGKGVIQSLMMEAGNVEKEEHVIINIPEKECGEVGTEAKNQIHLKEKRISENQETSRLALNATLLGCASTAYFGVNQHTYLDWLGMVYIICLILAIALLILGEHSQRRWMKRWGNYFTRGAIVLMVAVVIAAAVLGKKRGDIRTTTTN